MPSSIIQTNDCCVFDLVSGFKCSSCTHFEILCRVYWLHHHWHQVHPVQHFHKYCTFACIMYCSLHTALCTIFFGPRMVKWCSLFFFFFSDSAVLVIIHTPRFQVTLFCVDVTVFVRCAKLSSTSVLLMYDLCPKVILKNEQENRRDMEDTKCWNFCSHDLLKQAKYQVIHVPPNHFFFCFSSVLNHSSL